MKTLSREWIKAISMMLEDKNEDCEHVDNNMVVTVPLLTLCIIIMLILIAIVIAQQQWWPSLLTWQDYSSSLPVRNAECRPFNAAISHRGCCAVCF